MVGYANGDVLQGVATAAFTAAAYYGVGQVFSGIAKANVEAFKALYGAEAAIGYTGVTTGMQVAQIGAHAIVGGVVAELQGGKFGHGFVSAGVVKTFNVAFLGGASPNHVKGVFVSAIAGGTASELTGGKFANGAVTGAFQYAFNAAGDDIGRKVSVSEAYIAQHKWLANSLEGYVNGMTWQRLSDQLGNISEWSGYGATLALWSGQVHLAGSLGIISLATSVGSTVAESRTEIFNEAQAAGTGMDIAFGRLGRQLPKLLPAPYRRPARITLDLGSQSVGYIFRKAADNYSDQDI